MNSFPWNSVNRDRLYKAEDFAAVFEALFGNGVFPIQGQLEVYSMNGMKVKVSAGASLIEGTFGVQTEDLQVTLDTAHATLNRIDRIVVRRTESLRQCTIQVIKGTPASNPTAPNLTRTSDIYDICLAEVRVNAGTTNITQSSITSTTMDSSLCGYVTGKVGGIDTTALYNEIQTWFDETKTNFMEDATTYFQSVQSILNSIDPNGAILNELIDAREGKTSLKQNLNDNYVKNSQWGIGGIAPNYGEIGAYSKSSIYRRGNSLVVNMYHPSNGSKQFGVTNDYRIVVYNGNESKFYKALDEKNNCNIEYEDSPFSNGNLTIGKDTVINLANNIKILTGTIRVVDGKRVYVMPDNQQGFSEVLFYSTSAIEGGAPDSIQFTFSKVNSKININVNLYGTSSNLVYINYFMVVKY